jgi:peroxiredoxin
MILRLLVLLICIIPYCTVAQEVIQQAVMNDVSANSYVGNTIIEEEVVREFAPDFKITMENGLQKNLSDFRGEVVYLSFWASWCGPCIRGFNNYREMRSSMEELGVVMLNISIDDDHEKWRAAINEHQPTGIHGIVSHDEVRELYQLYNVPLYEIVGKKGQFLYLSDEPGRDILANFRKFIEEE